MNKQMNKIVCPSCGTEIELDDVNYSRIVSQVRTEQFDKEVAAQVQAVKEEQEAKHQSLLSDAANKYQLELLMKNQEIARLQDQAKNLSEKQQREMKAALDQAEVKHQKDLAENLNVTPKAVSRWERSVGYPDIETFQELASALGVSVLNLFDCSDARREIDTDELMKLVQDSVAIDRKNNRIQEKNSSALL